VTVEKEGQKIKYQIVGSDEANPTAGKISNDSPLGKAFLGHVLGDKILVTVPVGTASYVIVSIE
jgi:transcription elongation factor GreA